MNHLAHLALAGSEPAMLVGAILGDHVKGRLTGNYPADIERGIRLHRAIDAFTDQHAMVRQSQNRFDLRFRRYSGIILDVYFDYLLARSWSLYYPSELSRYSSEVLAVLVEQQGMLTDRAAQQVKHMHARNSLAAHGEQAYLEGALTHISTRLSRANPLTEAAAECKRIGDAIEPDFHAFYPCLHDFVEDWKLKF